MPELPEVETIRLQLDKVLKGLKITDVEVLTKKSFQGEIGEIRERRVIRVRRRAKITIIELENNIFLAIHLKLTGQLIYRVEEPHFAKATLGAGWESRRVEERESRKAGEQEEKYCEQKDGPFAVCELPNKYTRVIISFDNGGKLYFNDLRIFGWIKVIANCELSNCEFEKYGSEANDKSKFTLKYFSDILKKAKKPVKQIIMDQEKLAGLGNIYANEALFMAKILPTRPSGSLTNKEVTSLRESIIEVLNEAIKHKGSSDRDEAYRQITGEKGTHQNYLLVYGKKGQRCQRCGGTIQRIALGGRGTFFCSSCQY